MRRRSKLRLGVPPVVFTREWDDGACDCGGLPAGAAVPPGRPVIDVPSTLGPRPLAVRPLPPTPGPWTCTCGCGTPLLTAGGPGGSPVPAGTPLCACGCGRPLAAPPPQLALPPAGGTGYGTYPGGY